MLLLLIDEDKANQDAFCVKEEFCGLSGDSFMAVFDGHGRYGDKCAQFAKTNLPLLLERSVQQVWRARHKASGDKRVRGSLRAKLAELTDQEFETSCVQAHLECNRMMHRATTFDDSLSGTTAISACFHGKNEITVCNVGDSRAIMGQQVAGTNGVKGTPITTSYRAIPLSLDQTPYRRDERRRVKKSGARILSLDQIEGLEPVDDDSAGDEDYIQLGETIDEGGDPPRVWSPQGEYPGTAFTRSLGDVIAEELGVFAEPEIVTRQLLPEDKVIVLASDGVFEFLTNQSVIDICAKFDDPLAACRAVVAESYELWLQYELRTDDITIICIFVDDIIPPTVDENGRILPEKPATQYIRSMSESGASSREIADLLPLEEVRPVRHGASKTKMKAIEQMKGSFREDTEDDDIDISQLMSKKSEDDKVRIAEAIKASVIFKDVSDEQREMIYSVMEHVSVKSGDWVIRQGEMGDHFYIVETGKFEVRIVPQGSKDEEGTGGNLVHVYVGSRSTHAHPSFGELALMYSAPRAASIIAQTDGHLWALHRSVFKRVLTEHNTRREIRQNMRKLRAFKALTSDEVQKLVDSMEEITYEEGKIIVKQGESGDCFYFIMKGACGKFS